MKKKTLIASVSFIYLALIGITLLVCSVAFQSFRNTNIELGLAQTIEESVIEKGITTKSTKFTTHQVNYVVLKGNPQKFGIIKSDVLDSVSEGDVIKIYYKKSNNDLNIDVYQIERNGEIIRDKKEFEDTAMIAFYLALFGSLFMIGTIVWSITRIRWEKFR